VGRRGYDVADRRHRVERIGIVGSQCKVLWDPVTHTFYSGIVRGQCRNDGLREAIIYREPVEKHGTLLTEGAGRKQTCQQPSEQPFFEMSTARGGQLSAHTNGGKRLRTDREPYGTSQHGFNARCNVFPNGDRSAL
jgi:hypothetical protein